MNVRSEAETCPETALPYEAFPGAVVRLDRHRVIRGLKLEAGGRASGDAGSLLGRDFSAIFPPEVVSVLNEAIGNVAVDGRSRTVRCRFAMSSGATMRTATILPMADCGVLLILEPGTATAAEFQERAEGEPGFRTAFDHVHTFIGLMLPDGTLLDVNRAALDFCGARWSDVVGRPFWDGPWWAHSPELRGKLQFAIREAAAGRTSRFEVTHVAADGSTHTIDFSLTPVKDEAGYVVYLVPEGQDISARKATEVALHNSEQMLRIVLDAIPQGVFWKDRTLRYLGCNRIAAADSGVSNSEAVVGKTDFDLAWRDMAATYRADDQAVIDSGQAKVDFEEALAQPNGSVRWVRTNKIPLWDRDGLVVGLLGVYEDITARKKAEEALRESRELLRAILNTIPVRVFWKDKNLVYLGCNTPFAKDAGFESPEDVIGRDDYAMGWRAQADLYRADDLVVIASGEAKLLIEEPQMTPSGQQIHLLTSKLPLRDIDGAVIGVLGVYHDITAHKKAEVALRESETRMRAITDFAQDAILMIGVSGEISFWNPAAERIFGYSADEAVGKNLHRLIAPPRYWEAHERAFPDFLATGEGVAVGRVLDLEAVCKDGREIAIQLSLSSVRIGGAWNAIGITRDITAQKHLQRQQSLLTAAVESADEVVVITDTKGIIQYANPAFERVSGHLREDVLGKRASINKSGLHDDRFYRDMWAELLAGRVWKGRFKNRRKDGSHYDEDATISPVFDEQDRIVHFVAVKRDVTKELCLEEQLRQSQKLEAIGTLAGGIAHDFNNMLTAIIGHASLLMTSRADQQHVRDAATEIVNTGNRAAALTRKLLAYSRRQETRLEACNLNVRLNDLAGMLRRLIGDDIELLLELEENLKPVYMDATQLDQIVLNLVVNARDAIGLGGTIILETASRTITPAEIADYPEISAGLYAVLRCWDNGAGMAPTVAARIFDPFFTTKEQGKGTGLGLSTVYGIVKQAKGHVEVVSKENNGTCFTVLLPTLSETLVTPKADDEAVAPASSGVPGSGTILLADPREAFRSEIRQLLEANGYNVLEAVTAEEAVLTARHWPRHIGLLLIASDLLKTDGQGLIADIQAGRPDLAVLHLSDSADTLLTDTCCLDDKAGAVSSQCSLGQMLDEIRRLLAPSTVALGSAYDSK